MTKLKNLRLDTKFILVPPDRTAIINSSIFYCKHVNEHTKAHIPAEQIT